MAQVASELISVTRDEKLADSKYIKDEALENKKQSDINKDSLSGGVYNVTKLRLLQSGYYTITTAIAAVPQALRCVGMVITYQTASDRWETKQFKGALSNWTDSSKWEDFGGGGNNNGSGDGVYDISAANLTDGKPTSYASLQEALNAFTDTTQRKGGMSIMFIDSNNGRYRRYHLTAVKWSSSEVNWIEEIPSRIYEKIDITVGATGVSSHNGSINDAKSNGTINTSGQGKHIKVRIDSSSTYILSSQGGWGGWYGWFSSTTATATVDGTRYSVSSGSSVVLTIPSGANYIGLVSPDYNGSATEFTLIKVIDQSMSAIQEQIDDIKVIDEEPTENSKRAVSSGGVYETIQNIKLGLEDVDLSTITESQASLTTGTNRWYYANGYGKHKVVDVLPGEEYVLKNIGAYGYYGWLTSAYVPNPANNASIPYANNTTRIALDKNAEITLTVPSGAAYLCLCTYDGGGNKSNFILKKKIQDDMDSVPTSGSKKAVRSGGVFTAIQDAKSLLEEKKLDKYEEMNTFQLSEYKEEKYSLTTKTGTQQGWYYDDNKGGGYHKAIPITGGRYYYLDNTAQMAGWLASYTVPTRKTETIYWADGADRTSLSKKTFIQAPFSANFLIICTKGGDGSSQSVPTTITEYTSALDGIGGGSEQFVRFRIASWNVGHYNYYDGKQGINDTDITSEESNAMALRYRKAVDAINADIFGVCEDNYRFDLDGITPQVKVFANYEDYFTEAQRGYQKNTLYVNGFKKVGGTIVPITAPKIQASYYSVVTVLMGGRKVKIAEVHLDWGNNSFTGNQNRAMNLLQKKQLTRDFKNDPYVIIMGDFNMAHDWNVFSDRGYIVPNRGYLGTIYTWFSHTGDDGKSPIDNIIVKGFNISNFKAHVDETNLLSDHVAVSCDLTLCAKREPVAWNEEWEAEDEEALQKYNDGDYVIWE